MLHIYIYIYIYDISSLRVNDLTFILPTWRKWLAPNNASRQQMGFNSGFKGLIPRITNIIYIIPSVFCLYITLVFAFHELYLHFPILLRRAVEQIYLYLYPDGVTRFMHCVTVTQKPPDEVTPPVSKTVIGYYQEPFSPTSHLNVITSPSPYSNDQHSRRRFLLNERNMSSMTFLLHTV